jgi:hypothetical protein
MQHHADKRILYNRWRPGHRAGEKPLHNRRQHHDSGQAHRHPMPRLPLHGPGLRPFLWGRGHRRSLRERCVRLRYDAGLEPGSDPTAPDSGQARRHPMPRLPLHGRLPATRAGRGAPHAGPLTPSLHGMRPWSFRRGVQLRAPATRISASVAPYACPLRRLGRHAGIQCRACPYTYLARLAWQGRTTVCARQAPLLEHRFAGTRTSTLADRAPCPPVT